ncbi:MoaD/ThiS family protein [Corynebacterium renale]|uniref:MoaD/ThiS family protein n=1 Tax=Corynebacterium renale TaxID=1724 RepID=UPI0006540080|nr:MoaD/ThiS family protein [Corynebacterium renale]
MDVHYFAAARAARGVAHESVDGTFSTLHDLLEHLAAHNDGTTDAGMNLKDIFARCSFLIDGTRQPPEASLDEAHRVDILPPFAGG